MTVISALVQQNINKIGQFGEEPSIWIILFHCLLNFHSSWKWMNEWTNEKMKSESECDLRIHTLYVNQDKVRMKVQYLESVRQYPP